MNLNKLFNELWWYSDDIDVMKKFCSLVKEFCEWNRFYINIRTIDLKEYDFPSNDIYIIHSLSDNKEHPIVEKANETIGYIKECYNESDDKEYWENFWIKRLNELLLGVDELC